jgi:ABC-type spermidine/putrescine transport system permease subunit II
MTTRREFVKKSIMAGVATGFSVKSYGKIIGANDRVRVVWVSLTVTVLRMLDHLQHCKKK